MRFLLYASLAILSDSGLSAQSFRVNADLPRYQTLNRVGPVLLDPPGTTSVFVVGRDAQQRIFQRPIDASDPGRELFLTIHGVQEDLALDPSGAWLAFRLRVNSVTQLHVLRREPFLPAIRIDASLPFSAGVSAFRFTPDATHLAFIADPLAEVPRNDHYELYVAPVDGSAPPLLVGPVADPGGDVLDFRMSPDSTRVLYRVQDASGIGLYSALLDGSSAPVRLDPPRPFASVESDYLISNDGLGVVYRQDRDSDDVFELYVTRLDGSLTPIERSAPLALGGDVTGFALTPDDGSLVYRADAVQNERFELFVVGTFAGAPAVLSGAPVTGGDVLDFRLDGAGTTAVFRADLVLDGEERLFARPLDRSTPVVALAAHLASGLDVLDFELSGASALYRTDLGLHAAALDGGSSPLDLDLAGPVEPGYVVAREGTRAVFARRVAGLLQPFSVALDGSLPTTAIGRATSISNPSLEFFPAASGRTLFRAADGYDSTATFEPAFELWSARNDGVGRQRRINRPLEEAPPSGRVLAYQTSAGGEAIAYLMHRFTSDQPLVGGTVEVVTKSVTGREAHVVQPAFPLEQASTDLVVTATNRVLYKVDGELYGAPLDGSQLGARLHLPFSAQQAVDQFRATPDGAFVVFSADALTANRVELFRVPADGSSLPVRLGQELTAGRGVTRFELSPDGATVVYDLAVGNVHSLHSVPLDDSAPPVRLDLAATPGGDSDLGTQFRLTPDGATVLFVSDAALDEVSELYAVPIDGSTAPVQLSAGGGLVVNGQTHVQVSDDSTRVVYFADPERDDTVALVVAPLDGSTAPLVLDSLSAFVERFALDSTSSRVVYLKGDSLFVRALDGATPALALDGALRPNEHFSVHGERVVFAARTPLESTELHSVRLDGSDLVRLHAPLAPFDSFAPFGSFEVGRLFRASPDGTRIAFVADLLEPQKFELFLVPIDGSRPPRMCSRIEPTGSDALDFDGPDFRFGPRGRLFYLASQEFFHAWELFAFDLGPGFHAPR